MVERKYCYGCGWDKPLNAFSHVAVDLHNAGIRITYCKKCWRKYQYEWGKRNKATSAEKVRASFHSISVEYMRDILDSHGPLCDICGQEAKLVIDHDHITGAIRGLLCNHCNSGLGFFKDNTDSLFTAIKYLRRQNPYIPTE